MAAQETRPSILTENQVLYCQYRGTQVSKELLHRLLELKLYDPHYDDTPAGIRAGLERARDLDEIVFQCLWVAFVENQPIGVAMLRDDFYDVLNVYVHPVHRRQGIGSQLIAMAKRTGVNFFGHYTPTSKQLFHTHGVPDFMYAE